MSQPVSDSPSVHAACFTWITWLLLSACSLGLVAARAVNVPRFDEFAMVPVMTGQEPISARWLWSQHNEHRIPLPKLLLLGLYQISQNDFRAAMYVNALALSGLTAALIIGAKQLRGSTSYNDAYFPLALLHWGHSGNLLSGFQIQLVVSVVLAVTLLLIMVRRRTACLGPRTTIVGGLCLLFLPMCGASGLVYAATLWCWFVYAALALWRLPQRSGHIDVSGNLAGHQEVGARPETAEPAGWQSHAFLGSRAASGRRERFCSWLMLGFALATLIVIGLYFVGYQGMEDIRPCDNWHDTLVTSLQFCSLGFGLAGYHMWPFSAIALIGLLVSSVAALVVQTIKHAELRASSIGAALFLIASLGLALAIGWGRGSDGPLAGFAPRYVTLAVPLLCCFYYIWLLYGGAAGLWGQTMLFALACAAFPFNMEEGLDRANDLRDVLVRFEADVRGGVPHTVVAARYTSSDPPIHFDAKRLAILLHMLREAKVGLFRDLNFDGRDFDGHLQVVNRDEIRGWAYDAARPNTPILVEVMADGELVATVRADEFREGLLAQRRGDGRHGFSLSLPARLRDGQSHRIRARFAGTELDLEDSPASFRYLSK